HQDDRRPAGEAYHVDLEPLELAPARPAGDQLDGAVDVAVLGPGRVEHGRLRRDADVFGEGRYDPLVPGPLNERACAIVVDGHGGSIGPPRRRQMATVKLDVNGSARGLEIDDPQTPLLYVLRNDLGLTGTRFGCGLAQCGACTVMVDGRAVRSCST